MWFFKRKKKQKDVAEENKNTPVVEEKPVAEEVAEAVAEVQEVVKEVVVEATAKPEPKPEPTPEQISEPEAKPEPKPKEDLSKLTVAELKDLAKEKGLTGYSALKKAELVKLLNEK